jgi:Ser/Thr protein kinase RdoA (MazF antagonist)
MTAALFLAPTVLSADIPEIARLFDARWTAECYALGGMPNFSFKAFYGAIPIAIRVCNNEYTSRSHLEFELDVLLQLARMKFPFCAQLVRGRNGHYIQTWNSYPVIATTYIDGHSLATGPMNSATLISVGATIGRLTSALASVRQSGHEDDTFRCRSERLLRRMADVIHIIGWPVDVRALWVIWERESNALLADRTVDELVVSHTDLWPPNMIATRSGIACVDFDDLALAIRTLDLASGLAELAVNSRGRIRAARAEAMLRGFLVNGSLDEEQEIEELVAGIQCSYAAWLACDATHGLPFSGSQHYLRRLHRLAEPASRERLRAELRTALSRARASV